LFCSLHRETAQEAYHDGNLKISARGVVEDDTSLTGIAIIWSQVLSRLEVAVGCAAVSLASLVLGTKGSGGPLNTIEFMASEAGTAHGGVEHPRVAHWTGFTAEPRDWRGFPA
jgi:hypothetical protein